MTDEEMTALRVARAGEHHAASETRRWALPCPRPQPLLLAGDRLICPWPKRPHGELIPAEADQIEAARERIAEASRLPRLAWVTASAITPISGVDASWVARKAFDGMVVSAGKEIPTRQEVRSEG